MMQFSMVVRACLATADGVDDLDSITVVEQTLVVLATGNDLFVDLDRHAAPRARQLTNE